MTFFTFVFVILLLAAAATGMYQVIKLRLSPATTALLVTLRLCAIALLLVAFFEPLIVIERLPPQSRVVPVLIDASASMRLFDPDSTVSGVIKKLVSWNSQHNDKRLHFAFYAFGDSLRALRSSSLAWPDRRSFFPVEPKAPDVRQANAALLLTDGNWSNATLPSNCYPDKSLYFLPLSNPHPLPFLQIDATGFPKESPVDSTTAASIIVDGVSGRNGPLVVTVGGKNGTVSQKIIPVQPGPFHKVIKVTFRNQTAGRCLYRIDARLPADSIACSHYSLHTVVPDRFYFSVYNSHPTLDRRFFLTAMKQRHDFIQLTGDQKRAFDLLVLFSWDSTAEKLLGRLTNNGMALFYGCLPCKPSVAAVKTPTVQWLLPFAKGEGGPFDGMDCNKLPPPSSLLSCNDRAEDLLLSVVLPGTDHPQKVIYTGRTHGRHFIACAATDLWRWDFWPLAMESSEEAAFGFSERLMAFVNERLVNALSEDLLLYPVAEPIESDSLSLRIVFPAGLPVLSRMNMKCSIKPTSGKGFDTSFVTINTGSQNQVLRFRPIAEGLYHFTAMGNSEGGRYNFDDSLTVGRDQSEFMTNGQNTTLLQSIAQPLRDFDTASLRSCFFSKASVTTSPVKEIFHLNRNWPVLLLIFAFLAAEWIIRRMVKLD